MALETNRLPSQTLSNMLKYWGVDYSQLQLFYSKKLQAFQSGFVQRDYTGLIGNILGNMTRWILTNDIEWTTGNDRWDKIIKNRLFKELEFKENLANQLPYCILTGDMLVSIITDPKTGRPEPIFINDQNWVPISYNGNLLKECIWWKEIRVEDLEVDSQNTPQVDNEGMPLLQTYCYIICCKETQDHREVALFKYTSSAVSVVEYGSAAWTKVMGNMEPVSVYTESMPKFVHIWFPTFDPMWNANTPLHSGIFWNAEPYMEYEKAYNMLQKEMAQSTKVTFVNDNMTTQITQLQVGPHEFMDIGEKKLNLPENGTVHERCVMQMATLAPEDNIQEYNPQIRIREFTDYLNTTLSILSQRIGLGKNDLRFDQEAAYPTATQVTLSSAQAQNLCRRFASIIENALEKFIYFYWAALLDSPTESQPLIEGMITGLVPTLNEYDIEVHIRPAVIVDETVLKDHGLALVQSQIITPDVYLKKFEHWNDSALLDNLMSKINPMSYIQQQMVNSMQGGGGMGSQMTPGQQTQQQQGNAGQNKTGPEGKNGKDTERAKPDEK